MVSEYPGTEWFWAIGLGVLALVLAYAAYRARKGKDFPSDDSTPAKATDKPWEQPGKMSQDDGLRPPSNPNLEQW